jgi:O-antigen/teichoic acid export membrane protein
MTRIKQKASLIAFGDLSSRGLAFLASIYLARVLGAEYYGLITVAIAVLGYTTWAADLGLVHIGVREVAKDPAQRAFSVKDIFNLKVLLGTAVLVIATIVTSSLPLESIQKQVILGYLYSLIPYSLMIEWFFNGKQQFGKVAFSKFMNGIFYFILVVLLIKRPEDVTFLPILYTFGVTTAVVILATFALIDKPFVTPSKGTSIYPELLKKSSLIGVGGIFAQVVQLLPPILIAASLSMHDVGIYGAAFRVVLIAMLLDRIFVNLLLPNLSAIWTSDKKLAEQRVRMVLNIIIVGGTLIALLMIVNAKPIVQTLFGTEYIESAPILQILALFVFFTFLNSLFSFGLLATSNDKAYFNSTVLGGVLATLVIIIGAFIGNTMTAAIGVVVAECFLMLCSYFWFRKVIFIKPLLPIFIMLVLGGILFTAIELLNPHLIIANLLILVTIPLGSWYSKVIKIGELNWLREKLIR